MLVVEDNDDVGQFSTELLEDLGYTVRRVDNADAALAILGEDEFAADLVFSDVIMPGMNGVELAGVIRERYPGLPVVLTSGYSNVLAENAHRGFELIQKPYSVEVAVAHFAESDFRRAAVGVVIHYNSCSISPSGGLSALSHLHVGSSESSLRRRHLAMAGRYPARIGRQTRSIYHVLQDGD